MSDDMFPRVGALKKGYHVEQVDRYFRIAREIYDEGELDEMDSESVRTVAFDIVSGGYNPTAVDAALDRLERAFLQRRRADVVSSQGRQAWMEQVTDLAKSLYPRLLRPKGERFANAKRRGYDKTEVDAFLKRVSAYFDATGSLEADEVRDYAFRVAKGAKAYSEPSVDRYLARVVEVLISVE